MKTTKIDKDGWLRCDKCGRNLPVTNEHFYRSQQYLSGFNEAGCRRCLRQEQCKRENPDNDFVDYSVYDMDEFGRRAAKDALKRILEPNISIYATAQLL